MSFTVSVDVKQHWTILRHWSQFVHNMSTDIRGHEALHHHHCRENITALLQFIAIAKDGVNGFVTTLLNRILELMSPESAANHTVTKSYAASFTGLCTFGGVYVTEKRQTTLPSQYITLQVSLFYDIMSLHLLAEYLPWSLCHGEALNSTVTKFLVESFTGLWQDEDVPLVEFTRRPYQSISQSIKRRRRSKI